MQILKEIEEFNDLLIKIDNIGEEFHECDEECTIDNNIKKCKKMVDNEVSRYKILYELVTEYRYGKDEDDEIENNDIKDDNIRELITV